MPIDSTCTNALLNLNISMKLLVFNNCIRCYTSIFHDTIFEVILQPASVSRSRNRKCAKIHRQVFTCKATYIYSASNEGQEKNVILVVELIVIILFKENKDMNGLYQELLEVKMRKQGRRSMPFLRALNS